MFIIFNSAVGITDVSFSANGKTLTVTDTFSSGEVLLLDSQNKIVSVNGTEIDYDGTFPEFFP